MDPNKYVTLNYEYFGLLEPITHDLIYDAYLSYEDQDIMKVTEP